MCTRDCSGRLGEDATRTLLSWSSGKDSAWALHLLRADPAVEVAGLLTTVDRTASRVPIHGVPEALLERQAAAAGLPLVKVPIPSPCSNAEYEAAVGGAIQDARGRGVTAVAFGDLFLEDVRRYREERLIPPGMTPLFPIWGMDTAELAQEMLRSGLRAVITCVDPKQLAPSFAGRIYDARFLRDLPAGVDACGENGEFHTFAFGGPMFDAPVPVITGAVSEREGLVFAEVTLADPGGTSIPAPESPRAAGTPETP